MSRGIAEVQTPGRRKRSEGKKASILGAAEELFSTEGYERTTVDAIAARAQVSKRTVYDHFGDKETIFLRVLGRVNDALTDTVRSAIDDELRTGRDLREALIAFAHRIADETLTSSDYLTFRRLVRQPRPVPQLPEETRDLPEQLLTERFAELAAQGRIHAADPSVAARHFTALTIRLAQDETTDLGTVVSDGVDAFLRAYR